MLTAAAAAVCLVLVGVVGALAWVGAGEETQPATAWLENSVGMEFVLVRPGTFEMGSPKDEPERQSNEVPHLVNLSKPYYIGRYEVTEAQYAEVLGGDAPPGNLPVVGVTWEDAGRFCQELNRLAVEQSQGRRYRLPTEAEWEYCCRANTRTPFAFGEQLELDQARFQSRRLDAEGLRQVVYGPARVGSFAANGFGLHDMHGNVWEWCNDRYGPYDELALIDPTGPSEGSNRVLRGGGWKSHPSECRSARRMGLPPDVAENFIGFRVVCELVSP